MKKFYLLLVSLFSFLGVSAETIEIYCENLKFYDYAYMGAIYYEAENDDYFVSLGFDSSSMTGSFDTTTMSSWDTFITVKSTNTKLDAESVTCTAVADGQTYKVEGSMVCSDGNTYNFHLGYVEIAGETYTIDLSSEEVSKIFYDESCEWELKAENDEWAVAFDFRGSTPAMTLYYSNFDHAKSYIINKSTGATAYFSEIDYIGLRAGDYIYIDAKIKGTDHNTYNITMTVYDRVVDIVGRASLNVYSANVDNQIADYGYFAIQGIDETGEYLVSLGAKAEEIEGVFRSHQLVETSSWIEVGNVRNYFVSGGFTMEAEGDGYNCKGELLADDGIMYSITMTTAEPDGLGRLAVKTIAVRKVLDNNQIIIATEKSKFNAAGIMIK